MKINSIIALILIIIISFSLVSCSFKGGMLWIDLEGEREKIQPIIEASKENNVKNEEEDAVLDNYPEAGQESSQNQGSESENVLPDISDTEFEETYDPSVGGEDTYDSGSDTENTDTDEENTNNVDTGDEDTDNVDTDDEEDTDTDGGETSGTVTDEPTYDGNKYGRSTISGKAGIVYDLLEKAIMAEKPKIKVGVDESDQITIEDVYLARYMFLSDHPECFWWNGDITYTYTKDGYIVYLDFEYTYRADELQLKRQELDAAVEEILINLPDGSNFDKMLYLHDAVAGKVVYTFTENDQTAYGALVEGMAVCNGYATSYQLLLQKAGIRAWTVNGYANGEAHAWNVVWLSDDICVYTDVTWNDQEDHTYHYYFNMSLEEIDDDHSVNEVFKLPECGHGEYGYSDLVWDCNIINQYDKVDVLQQFLTSKDENTAEASFFFVGDSFEKWLKRNEKDIFGIIGCSSYHYNYFGNEIVMTFEYQ